MDGGDAVLVGELAHKTKPADTASETSSLPEQKGFRGFVLLDTQDFTGEPRFLSVSLLTRENIGLTSYRCCKHTYW
jgi:hypothetical protein